MRSDQNRLGDILDAITKIQERTSAGGDAFRHDEMLQVWVIHHLQVIGEAARGLSREFRDLNPTVRWAQQFSTGSNNLRLQSRARQQAVFHCTIMMFRWAATAALHSS